jgi:hypothetical protein
MDPGRSVKQMLRARLKPISRHMRKDTWLTQPIKATDPVREAARPPSGETGQISILKQNAQ